MKAIIKTIGSLIPPILKLVRWNNLLIIAFAQYAVRWFLIKPVYRAAHVTYILDHTSFFCLVLSTVFIAAAGYVINAYHDVRIDRVNKPDEIILVRYISFRQALALHLAFNILGILLGFYAAIRTGSLKLGGIQLVVAALLWLYSVKYKRMLFWGNFVISLLTGLVVIIVWLYEFYGLRAHAIDFAAAMPSLSMINRFIITYFLFAFLTNFIREILKDIEDIEGDRHYDCISIPIRFGIQNTRYLVISLCLFLVLVIFFLQTEFIFHFSKDLLWHSILLVQLPFLFLTYWMIYARTKQHFHLAGQIVRLILVLGLSSMIFIGQTIFPHVT
jgi:4-hydroxybenzoate polyprenyltransferase